MAKHIIVFGDSVEWGQGHLETNKFATRVGAALRLPVQMIAHSGATIGVGDLQTGLCGPEAPLHYPTILQQLASATDNPADAAVVILDGGINDVGVQTIVSPFTLKRHLRHVTRRYCHDDMSTLLRAALSRYQSPSTKIVVTSYFPVFSTKSDLGGVLLYLRARGLAPAPQFVKEEALFALRSVELALLFWQESRQQLQAAVDEMHSERTVFADVPFTEDNAMFAPEPWLFNVHVDPQTGLVAPEDDVIPERHAQCQRCHPNDPFGVYACDIASAGHPNRVGSVKFSDTILAAIG